MIAGFIVLRGGTGKFRGAPCAAAGVVAQEVAAKRAIRFYNSGWLQGEGYGRPRNFADLGRRIGRGLDHGFRDGDG